MTIRRMKQLGAPDGRPQEFRIRFAIAHTHLSQTRRDQARKRVIFGHTFVNTARLRNEDHVELRVMRRDRLFQSFDKSESQFDTSSVGAGHDGVRFGVLLRPLRPKGMAQSIEAVANNTPNAALPVEGVKYAVANMIVVQDLFAFI